MGETMADYAKRENAAVLKATQLAGTYADPKFYLKAGNANHYGANDCLRTERQINSFKRMWREGFSVKVISERFLITPHDVTRKAKKLKLPMRGRDEQYG